MPKPPVTDLNVSSRRYSGWSVSGRRKKAQKADQRRKAGHEHEDRLPRAGEQQYLADAGAMMGMAMKTMKISDMTSAMSRPLKRSRTTAVATTRIAAAPRPCVKRRARRTAKFGAKVAAKAQTT